MARRLTLFQPSRRYATVPTGALNDPAAGARGTDDDFWLTQIYGGGPDINPELTGSQKFRVYDEMSKTDAAVKSLLLFWMLPVRSAKWTLAPRPPDTLTEPDGESIAIRDAVDWQFGIEDQDGQLNLSWKELLAQGMGEQLKMGACIEELVWADLASWRDADGDEHPIRPLSRVALRPARTIAKVEFTDGRIKSVTQMLAETSPMPGDKLSYMVFEREGGRWDGVSALRAAWGAWTIKKQLMIAAGIGWDRFASGIPIVWHPDNPEAEIVAENIGYELRQHERSYVHLPTTGPSQGVGKPESEWLVELLDGANSLADPTPLLSFLSNEIAMSGIQQFSRQGMGRTGARATAETQIDPYFLAVQELADYQRRERQRQVMKRFVAVNFGEEAADLRTPILSVSKIQARDTTTISNAIGLLAGAGLTFTDRDTQNDIRDLLGLGDLPAVADTMGISPADLESALRSTGMDPATLAQIIDALPPSVGVARNTVPTPEGQLAPKP